MLVAERITKTYPGRRRRRVRALTDVSVILRPGQRVGLVGPSGSGKTTLAQVLALLLEPDSGQLHVDGQPIRLWGVECPRELRHRVQLLWQSPRLAVDPRLRLDQLITEPLAASKLLSAPGQRTALLRHWAERLGLTADLLPRYPHEVSEGQLQRACLARALILGPRYLICDELGSMLDVSTQAALLHTIAEEQRRRELGVLLITHDRVLARHWCEHTVTLGTAAGDPTGTHPGPVWVTAAEGRQIR